MKISPEKVAEMVRLARSGVAAKDITRHMGVSRCTVARHTGWNPVKRRAYADPAPALRMKTWYRSYVYPDWRITKRIWAEDYGDGTYGWWSDYAVERVGSNEIKVHNTLISAERYIKAKEAAHGKSSKSKTDHRDVVHA